MADQTNNKTIILHIGRHKTGTSSIQATLAANRDVLQRRGVLFPSCLGANHSGFFINAFSHKAIHHPNNSRHGLSQAAIERHAQDRLDCLQREISDFTGHTVIFSGEDAGTVLSKDDIRRMKARFDAIAAPLSYKVILYTRHPLSRAMSGMQQNVKGNGLLLEEAKRFHLKGGGPRYREIYQKYAEIFGEQAISVRSFETARSGARGLFGDFCDAIGISDTELEIHRDNDSISPEVVLFLSWLYDGPPASPERLVHNRKTRIPLSERDRAILYSLRGGKADFLTAEERHQLWQAVSEDVAFLQLKFNISYAEPEPQKESDLFGDPFITSLAEKIPEISSPMRRELMNFLLERSSTAS